MGLLDGSSASSSGSNVCPAAPTPEIGTAPVVGDWTIEHLFNVISGAFMGATCLISLLLCALHATHYSNPHEQTKMMRIIFFMPVYAVVSFGDIYLQGNSVYLQPWASVYEAFALASFFMLVNTFISPDHSSEAAFFDKVKLKSGKTAGAAWFNRSRRIVFQYTPVAIIVAVATDITMAANVYCETTNSVHFSKLWLTVIRTISVTAAAFAAIGFTFGVRSSLPEKKVVQKLIAFKLVVFLETIQNLVFTIVKGHVTPTETLGYYDITVGIPSLMLCIELFLVSILLHFTYSWRPYVLDRRSTGTRYHGFFSAILATLNPFEIFREFAYGFGIASPPRRYNNLEQGPEEPLQAYAPTPYRPQAPYSQGY